MCIYLHTWHASTSTHLRTSVHMHPTVSHTTAYSHHPLHTHPHTDTHATTCQHSMPAPPTQTHVCTHTPMHTCTLHVHPNPTARTLVFLEDGALRLMLGLCPTFLKILWDLANGPRPRAGCLWSPLLGPHHLGRVPGARSRPWDRLILDLSHCRCRPPPCACR